MTAAVLVAADEPPVEPGQPYVSPDDLASITPLWQQAVAQTLIPVVAEVFHASAGVVHARMVDATQVPTLPSIGSLAAEQYLAQAGNTFAEVGDRLWATARSELLDGFEKGESIPQLAARLRASAGMTAKTATLVARTQVLDASNAGSIATARATGLELRKGWLDTPDQRTRPTHHQAGNTYGSDQGMIPLADQFTVGGYQCDRPHDPTLPPAERYNCRCAVIYSMVDAAVDEAVRAAEPVPPLPGETPLPTPLPDVYAGDLVAPALPGPDVGIPGAPAPLPGLAVRPSLEAARTTYAVQYAFQQEARQITGRFLLPVRFTGSAATAREHAEGLLRGLERFPDAKLAGIDAIEARGSAYAATSYSEILFSETWTSPAARRRYLSSVAADVENGWHVANSGSPVSIALHEFGHLLDFTSDINRGMRLQVREVVARRAAAAGVAPDVLIAREVSQYATSHVDELVAEAFTDVMVNGEAASVLSKDIFTLLEAAYRQAGGTVRTVSRKVALAVPSPASALAAKTVPQLRALAKERGITIPAGSKKADIVRILDENGVDLSDVPSVPKLVKARAGSTIGDVELGPTQFDIAIGEADLPKRPVGAFTDRPFDGPDGAVEHRGERLPAGFVSRLSAIRRGEFAVRPGLTEAESQALDRYVLSRVADPLNTGLRQGAIPPFGTVEVADQVVDLDQVLAQLDSAIAASRLAADTTLYRGALMRLADLRKLQPGAVTREDGFLSTTTDSSHAFGIINWRQGRDPTGGKSPVVFEILAPRGTHGAVAGVGEREVLLGRGRRFRVVEVRRPTTPGGVRRIVLEPLPDETPPVPAAVEVPLAKRTIAVGADALEAAPSSLVTGRGLTTAQKSALRFYQDQGGHDRINNALRAGEDVSRMMRVTRIDEALAGSPLTEDVLVYRGAFGDRIFGDRLDGDLIGFEWTDPAYQSTSAQFSSAAGFGGEHKVILEMRVPAGTRGVTLSRFEKPGPYPRPDEAELLLDRGLRMRVVGERFVDRGGLKPDRVLTVEVVPGGEVVAVPVAEIPLAKRTVAQLRALAADRKITIPAGARKPDIVRLLEAPPLTQAEERAAARAAARETNRLIEESTANAQVLAEVDALLAKKAPAATIREALDAALVEPGQLFAGADAAILAALRAVAADPVKLRAAVTRLGGKIKVKPVSKAGAKVVFDADTMEGVGGIDIPAGAKVTVVRRGSTVTLPDGTVMQLEKARVTPVAAPVRKAAPVKRTPAPKASPSQRQPGRDLLSTSTAKAEPVEVLKAAAQRDAWVDRAAAEQRFGDPVIKVLTTAVRQQDGWSTPARVVTPAQLDRLVDSGWTEMWRGVEANHTGVPSISATDIARATRTGDWQMTKGIYGNGVYTTARRTTAEMYRGGTIPDFDFRRGIPAESFGPAPMYEYLPGLTPSPQGSGGLMRMVLDPNAKIIDYEDLRAEHREFLSSEAYHSMPYGAFKRELGDSSFYAVMRGYDGIRVHGPHHNDGAIYPEGVTNRDEPPQWVIFNRSVLVFERASKRYDT